MTLAFALFFCGFGAASAPVQTATVLWSIAGILIVAAVVCSILTFVQ